MSITAYIKGGKKAYRAEFEHKGKRHSKAGFTTQGAAKIWVAQEKTKLKKEAKNTPQQQQTLMFSAASAMYMDDCRARMQPGTVAEKYRHLTEYAEFLEEDCPVNALPPQASATFIAEIQKRTTDEKGNPILGSDGEPIENNNKTANRYLRTLNAFWNWTAKRHAIGASPFISIEPYPEDTPPLYVPPAEDVSAVLSVAQQWELDFLHILVKTGARPGEVRSLKWPDVDFHRQTITLWTRKRKGGKREPGVINMSGQLAGMLKRRFQERESEIWVFINPETKKPFTRQSRPYKYLMERLCERASEARKKRDPSADNIMPFTFYSFRHFVAVSLRLSGKANKYEIRDILRHKRTDTTDIYLRSLVPDLHEAVSALDDVVDIPERQNDGSPNGKIIPFGRK